MDCDSLAKALTDFLEGRLPKSMEDQALDHLATCSKCEVVLAETRNVMQLARDHGAASLDDHARARLRTAILDAE